MPLEPEDEIVKLVRKLLSLTALTDIVRCYISVSFPHYMLYACLPPACKICLYHSGLAEKEMDVKKYTNKENGRK
jgi:hypothetical protein